MKVCKLDAQLKKATRAFIHARYFTAIMNNELSLNQILKELLQHFSYKLHTFFETKTYTFHFKYSPHTSCHTTHNSIRKNDGIFTHASYRSPEDCSKIS